MPLTDENKQRIRYHLGYANLNPMIAMINGVAAPQQTSFLVDTALERVQEATIPYVLQLSSRCDTVENDIFEARDYLAVEKVDTITLRGAEVGYTHTDLLEREYLRWVNRLCDVLGVPQYPFSKKLSGARGAGINTPVTN